MDEATGKPAAGQRYGTHLTGGFHGAIEGPFILYSPDTDYYYLFTSFGSSAVKKDIHLPRTGPFAAAVERASSHPATISVEWIRARPDVCAPPANVILTAMVSLDGENATRDFEATVSPLGPPDSVAHYRCTGNFASGIPTGPMRR